MTTNPKETYDKISLAAEVNSLPTSDYITPWHISSLFFQMLPTAPKFLLLLTAKSTALSLFSTFESIDNLILLINKANHHEMDFWDRHKIQKDLVQILLNSQEGLSELSYSSKLIVIKAASPEQAPELSKIFNTSTSEILKILADPNIFEWYDAKKESTWLQIVLDNTQEDPSKLSSNDKLVLMRSADKDQFSQTLKKLDVGFSVILQLMQGMSFKYGDQTKENALITQLLEGAAIKPELHSKVAAAIRNNPSDTATILLTEGELDFNKLSEAYTKEIVSALYQEQGPRSELKQHLEAKTDIREGSYLDHILDILKKAEGNPAADPITRFKSSEVRKLVNSFPSKVMSFEEAKKAYAPDTKTHAPHKLNWVWAVKPGLTSDEDIIKEFSEKTKDGYLKGILHNADLPEFKEWSKTLWVSKPAPQAVHDECAKHDIKIMQLTTLLEDGSGLNENHKHALKYTMERFYDNEDPTSWTLKLA